MVECQICHKNFKYINNLHLRKHNINFNMYVASFPNFPIIDDDISKIMSETHKDKPKSEEHKKKISDSKKGKPSHRKGKKQTEEAKQKISKKNLGRLSGDNNPAKRLEVRQKISEFHKDKPKSEEHKKKLSEVNKGKYPSYETRKKLSEASSRENNPNWKGGITEIKYCERWTEELREEIRIRDDRICQKCNKTELENGRKLSVHHIHYKKEDCYPDLITLCSSCHGKANFNRNYWEEHFMEKLRERNLLNYFGDKI